MQAGLDCKGSRQNANYKLGYSHIHQPWTTHEPVYILDTRMTKTQIMSISACSIHCLPSHVSLLCCAAVSSRQQRRFQHHTGVDQNKRRRLLLQQRGAPGRSNTDTNETLFHTFFIQPAQRILIWKFTVSILTHHFTSLHPHITAHHTMTRSSWGLEDSNANINTHFDFLSRNFCSCQCCKTLHSCWFGQ